MILSPKNVECLIRNEEVLKKLPGESKAYMSCAKDGKPQNHPMEFINSLAPHDMPPDRLTLKICAILTIAGSLSIAQGLCTGTRMKLLQFCENSIELSQRLFISDLVFFQVRMVD